MFAMGQDVRWRLYGMMFLLYFSLGSWAVTLTTYLSKPLAEGGLGYSPWLVGWTYSTFAFAGMIAPICIGPLADRWFRAERVLVVSSLVAGVLLGAAGVWCQTQQHAIATATDSVAETRLTFYVLFAILLVYCFFLQLSLTLTNVMTHRNHPLGSQGYSRTRLWGTVGWIVAGNVLGWVLQPISAEPLYLASASSILLGFFALTLPKTSPLSRETKLLPALRLFRIPSFCVFVFAAFMATVTNQFYGVHGHRTLTDMGVNRPEQILTIGQVVEVVCMFVIPWLLPEKRLKFLMLLGLIGWVVRGLVMSYGGVEAIIAVAVPMHGWSFAFFFVVAQTYLKRTASPDLMAGTQGIVQFISGGAGAWIGNVIAGQVIAVYSLENHIDWAAVWVTPMLGCMLATVVFVLFFHAPKVLPKVEDAS
jgi:nucleoside transporter